MARTSIFGCDFLRICEILFWNTLW
jgi:hypothetical protein